MKKKNEEVNQILELYYQDYLRANNSIQDLLDKSFKSDKYSLFGIIASFLAILIGLTNEASILSISIENIVVILFFLILLIGLFLTYRDLIKVSLMFYHMNCAIDLEKKMKDLRTEEGLCLDINSANYFVNEYMKGHYSLYNWLNILVGLITLVVPFIVMILRFGFHLYLIVYAFIGIFGFTGFYFIAKKISKRLKRN